MNKSRIPGTILLVLVILVSVTSVAYALASGPAAADATVYASNPDQNINTGGIRVEAGDPICAQARWSFVKWDLSDIPGGTILASANLSFYVQLINGDPSGAQIELYQVTDDTWSETTITANNDPAFGTAIQSVPIPAVGQAIVFNNTALLSYLQQEADGNNIASFGLALKGNCSNATVMVALNSKDAAVADAQKPYLDVRTGGPTAVTITDSTAQQTNALPLYAGLGALALIAVAGVAVSRRRAAAAR